MIGFIVEVTRRFDHRVVRVEHWRAESRAGIFGALGRAMDAIHTELQTPAPKGFTRREYTIAVDEFPAA